jgi:hypothetical protein
MPFLKLCHNDPLLSLLRDTFNANPVRVPEQRILPLCAIIQLGDKSKFLGRIENLMTDTTFLTMDVQSSQMADVSAKKSRTVNLKLGLEVLDGFLSGMGAGSASIKGAFQGVEKVSFSFQNVVREWLDIGELGSKLIRRNLNPDNATSSDIINNQYPLLVIDSIITSNNFTINIEKTLSESFKLNIPEIETLIHFKDNSLEIKSSNGKEISFKGPQPLAFAFSGIRLYSDIMGQISFDLIEKDRLFRAMDIESAKENGLMFQSWLPEFVIFGQNGLVDLDFT